MIVRPLPISGIVFLSLCIAILCALGTWQVKRLAWKTELIRTMELAFIEDPLQNPLTTEHLKRLAQEPQPFFYGSITGTFMSEHFLVGPRTQEGAPGYHRLVGFTLSDGASILVNRGWISLQDAEKEYVEEFEPVTLTGLVRRPDRPNMFTPENDPASNTWFSVDPHAMAKSIGLPDFANIVFYSNTHNLDQSFPRNNHLQYAIFWFSMAFLFAALPLAYAFWPLPKE